LFKRIAFAGGLPHIIVDLFIYLCGSSLKDQIKSAMKLLRERVGAKRYKTKKIVKQ